MLILHRERAASNVVLLATQVAVVWQLTVGVGIQAKRPGQGPGYQTASLPARRRVVALITKQTARNPWSSRSIAR